MVLKIFIKNVLRLTHYFFYLFVYVGKKFSPYRLFVNNLFIIQIIVTHT